MTPSTPLRAIDGGVHLDVKVIPRSPRNALGGLRGSRLLLRVTAPPVDNAANEAVTALIAELLGIPKRAVRVVAGATSRQKTIEAIGVDGDGAAAALGLAAD